MSLQQSLLENALKKATKEAEKLKLNDTPQPIDRDEARRHQNLVDLIHEKRQRVLELSKQAKERDVNRKLVDAREIDFETKVMLSEIVVVATTKADTKKRNRNPIQSRNILVMETRGMLEKDEALKELLAKKHLIGTTAELEQALLLLQQELAAAKEQLSEQQEMLQEHQQVRDALTKKLIDVEAAIDSEESPIGKLREEYRDMNANYRRIMNNLHDFLDQTYPPKSVRISARAPPGGQEDMEVEFSLKDLLMELMNASYNSPNSYLRLEEGTYWPPYIETLIKARIVVRHPTDATKLKLEDYRL
ncbi:hypothetical protein INT43_007770 [Umbelopsis isabellina]|uniref:Centromere protein K n=1 Tax=Mortierella isabellina TaxID=91625 RepID=A0A8H7UF67_MORIS|nr:hypothetical protein INT43_007770 [Umbelopsis isabellina]